MHTADLTLDRVTETVTETGIGVSHAVHPKPMQCPQTKIALLHAAQHI